MKGLWKAEDRPEWNGCSIWPGVTEVLYTPWPYPINPYLKKNCFGSLFRNAILVHRDFVSYVSINGFHKISIQEPIRVYLALQDDPLKVGLQ